MTISRAPSRQIAADLRQHIADGNEGYRPGDKIPALQALAAQYEVDYKTARKAIQLLIAEGLVEVDPGLGTFVREASTP